MKVKLMLDARKFEHKPTRWETTQIQGYTVKKTGVYHPPLIKPMEIEIEDLAYGLCSGYTCKPALLIGSKSADWVEQQVFMLDFDHDTTITTQLDIANNLGIKPVFVYTSFRHTEDEPRFRMVFINDYIITDVEKRNKLQSTLIRLFDKSDKVTFDPTRIFYGGKGLYPIAPNYENRINVDEILDKYYIEESTTKKVVNKSKNEQKIIKKTSKKPLENTSKVECIKSLNASKYKACRDSLKGVCIQDNLVYNDETVVVRSKNEFYRLVDKIDLHDFLGMHENEFINCILPNHKHDTDPSAHIYTTKDGTQVYKCFGCGKALKIRSLVEVLGGTTKRKAEDFIRKVYNIRIEESEWVKEQKEILEDNAYYIMDDTFNIEFPYLSKLIRTRKPHLLAMISYFSTLINEESQLNDRALYYSSYNQLLETCGLNKNRTNTLAQTLTLFTLLNMIEKVDPESLPIEILKKAKELSKMRGYSKITNFYQVEEYGYLYLSESEDIAKVLLDNNVTMKALSREYILRTFGTELADKVYPQYKYENEKIGTSKKSDNESMKIAKKILKKIEKQGYILEKDIKVNGKTETQWKKSIQEILDTYSLVRVKASKINKEKYGLPEKIPYQAFVICKERD